VTAVMLTRLVEPKLRVGGYDLEPVPTVCGEPDHSYFRIGHYTPGTRKMRLN
jgi:hypothetical protein